MLATTVGVLHEAGASAPVGGDAPSIWPALARQIRASRHERPNPWSHLSLIPSLGLAAGLLVAGTAIGLVSSRIQPPSAPRPRPAEQTATSPAPRPALPEGPAQPQLAAQPQTAPKPDVRLELDPRTGTARDSQRAVGQ